ncbi:helicase [Matsumuraeses phaseoli granulovirus]|uniref:Helicase n=1 Tax=Matsumuraeses phaseoli granulovirus TaxID=2760664 RepID=A0AAE7SXQ3_9BBAC|nr:helicase [Matsumuraeses phaseoli granulovirus]QOD40044.1 helicase [Matsumuraeses phaseoli granulovirus]
MSVEDIMNSYESVSQSESVSYQYWYFTNGTKIVRRECKDVAFIINLLNSASEAEHNWCMVPNYFNTKVIPFLPYKDYVRLNKENPQMFLFTNIRNVLMSDTKHMGDYIIWPNMSAHFLGWIMYLYLNGQYKLAASIPLVNNDKLGAVNLLSNEDLNFDISCKIFKDEKIIFTNTDSTPSINVFTLEPKRESTIEVLFDKKYINANTKMWTEYLLNNEEIDVLNFLPEYHFICEKINFEQLRWSDGKNKEIKSVTDIKMKSLGSSVDRISPCSNFEIELKKAIEECLEIVNTQMINKSPPSFNNDQLLNFYLKSSNYSTFYILIISVWQYCEASINMHNQYNIEDILFFVKWLCLSVDGGEDLFVDNLIYFSSKNTSKNFMNSLYFFIAPSQGVDKMNEFFDAISSYYSLHLSIYSKTESWTINSNTVSICDIDLPIKSVGFFKKLKVGKFDYIFNGNTYENYKNKKEHALASTYEASPEVSVSTLLFNKTLNFYMTQDGLFDVCKKVYKEPCPFIVMSTLKKNYITRDQVYLDQSIFFRLYQTIDKDLNLFKVYHARKFLDDYDILIKNLKDISLVGEKMNGVREELEAKWRDTINWLLEYKASDLIVMIIKLQDKLSLPINNIIKYDVDVDLMGLQVAVVCHLVWPNSKIETFFWAIQCITFQDFEDWLEDYDYEGLVTLEIFENKKKIIEAMHRWLYKINYREDDVFSQLKLIIEGVDKRDDKKYETNRVIKNIGNEYKKYKKIPNEYNVWTDNLIEHRKNENMYTWLTRFYVRMFFRDYVGDQNLLMSVVEGFSYFRVFTNFHANNSKVMINFCASLAIPVDNEKMCIVLTSMPNCGKNSLWQLLMEIILVAKQDKDKYKHNKDERDEKVKTYESQLYVMNEAEKFSKNFLKSMVDSNRIDSARCNYSVMENFNITFKVLVCNNEEDKIFVTDGYDKACSNRIGQIYFDHYFDPEIKRFTGSLYEHHIKKRYCEVKDINFKLISSIKQFLANVLKYNCNPDDGLLYYKYILQGDNTYKHNKKCLYIYNTRLEALLYVMNVKECKTAPEFGEEVLYDLIKCAEKYVTQMVHWQWRKTISFEVLCSDFKRKFNTPRHYNTETKTYQNLTISMDEKYFKQYAPKFKANVDEPL